MTWFRKGEPREAWEIDDGGSVGDIEVARQIREICNSVAESAEAVSVLYYGPSTETKKRQIDRYERAKKRAEKQLVVLHSGSDGLGSGGQISSGRSFGSTRTSMLRGVLGFLPMKPAPSSVSTIW